MKEIIYLVLLFSLISCSSQDIMYQADVSEKFSYSLDQHDMSPKDFPIDSNYYKNLLLEGYEDDCAYLEAYGMNDIILERTLPGKCHKQYIRFKTINAYKLNDTVFVVFSTIKNEVARRSSKLLFVKIFDNDYEIDLVHSGSLYQEVYHYDGSITREPAKISKVKSKNLTVNKGSFQEGDVIAGKLKVKSFVPSKRRGETVEVISGHFRAVLKSPEGSCDGVFSYID